MAVIRSPRTSTAPRSIIRLSAPSVTTVPLPIKISCMILASLPPRRKPPHRPQATRKRWLYYIRERWRVGSVPGLYLLYVCKKSSVVFLHGTVYHCHALGARWDGNN